MYLSTFSTIAVFLLYAHLSSAIPAPPSLFPRTDYCANAPKVVAGTLLPARSLPFPLTHPRTMPPITGSTRWCCPGTRTYIYVTLTTDMAMPGIRNLIDAAWRFSQDYIELMGDGVMPVDAMNYDPVAGYRITFANTNNHQLTWGVYGSALVALKGFMEAYGWGPAVFRVIDGSNAVATGVLKQVPLSS